MMFIARLAALALLSLTPTLAVKQDWHRLSFDSENFVCDEFDDFCEVCI
jgi:hypothetical protein